ncbi:DUF2809 domain-containing protein [Microbacterium sp. 2FI]|uniref:ribosomal maturation YjgA family protein n=1 Tax=Microbacterium sp. 2FI TaxID=2502193 RepID=UPI002016EA15|nr:DUF2809 domain-containing protein [Microbacterium sp. 2FI]
MTGGAGAATGRRARRIGAAVVLAIVIAAGLFVAAVLPDTAATDIAGDALYAVAAYIGLVMLAPRARSLVIGAIALGWCVAVELFQLTGVPLALGAAFPPAMLVLGTVFDARDLVVYAVAVVAVCAIDFAVRGALGRRRARAAETGSRG